MIYTQSPRGFTLIELAMIIAATAIVGAVGVSAYHTYSVRMQIAASVAAITPFQRAVESVFRESGLPPADKQAGRTLALLESVVEESEFIGAIDIAQGRVQITFDHAADEAIANRQLSVTPFETADLRIVWICGNKIPGPGLEPLGFAGGGPQALQVLSTIDARYLPPTCR
jgi:Tfp pilus assembly protein PilE